MSTGSAGAIRQGRAFVELFTDDTKLKQGLRMAEKSVRKFGASVSRIGLGMMAAGAAILAPLVAATKLFGSMGDNIAKMATRTGFSVEALSAFKFAMERSGSNAESLEKGIRKMQQTLYQAGFGLKTYTRLLDDLGLNYATLKGMKPEDQFRTIVGRLANIADKSKQAAIAVQMFGRAGTGLLPMLTGGAAGMQALLDKAKELGLVMSTKDAQAAEVFTDSMGDLVSSAKMAAFHVGAALATEMMRLGDIIKRVIPRINEWVQGNKGWIVLAAKAALYAVGLGAAMFVLGKAIATVAFAIGVVRTVIVPLIGFLITWPGIIMAAVAALIYFTGGFKELGRVFKQVWGGIADAISAGDLKLAMQILWAGIVVVWTAGINSVYDFFSSLWAGLQKIVAYAGGGLMAAIMALVQGIHWLWTETWTRIANGWTETWSRLKTSIIQAKSWLGIMSDAEASAAIKAEIEVREKTIRGRQDTRAAEHAEDAKRVDDTVKAMNARVAALDAWNAANVMAHKESTERRKQELADLIAQAKAAKEAMKVNPEAAPGGATPGTPDIAGGAAAEKSSAVAGGFDIGALLSFQAGANDSKLDRIAAASERTADATEALSEYGLEASYGG